MVRQYSDYILEEYCEYWDEQTGVRVSPSTMCRELHKQQWSIKKTLRSSQAATQEKQQQRLEYWSEVKEVKTKNLVFLDEMGVLLGLMRADAIRLKGKRAYDLKPFYRGKRITVIGAMTQNCVLAMKTIDKGMNGEDFQLWSQLKSFLRKFIPKTQDAVDKLLEIALMLSNSEHFRNWFAHCCYCTN